MIKDKKHNWVRKNIIRYIDGDLTEKEKIDYANHLSNCESCHTSYKKIEAVLKDGYIKQLSPNYLLDRVNGSITNFSTKITDNLFEVKYKLSYVFFLVIIALGTFFGNAFIFVENENLNQNIAEVIFPIATDDLNSAVELSLLNVIENEK